MDLEQLINYAIMAPSGHNTQPWKFSVERNVICIFPDFKRRLPVVDPDDYALYISLGCALENLVISAKQHGLKSRVDYFPSDEYEECIRITFTGESNQSEKQLFDVIPVRQSNRSMYNRQEIPSDDLEKLQQANKSKMVIVKTIGTEEDIVQPIIDLVKVANRIQFNDRQFVEELLSWIRFTKKEMKNRKDGLTAEVMGFPFVPRWLGRLILKTFAKPETEALKSENQIRSSSLLMLFISKKHDKRHWVDLGRSFQRIALTATSLGLAHAHLNMPCEVESVRKKLSSHLELDHDEQPLLLIRFGYAKERPRSPRRPAEEVIIQSDSM